MVALSLSSNVSVFLLICLMFSGLCCGASEGVITPRKRVGQLLYSIESRLDDSGSDCAVLKLLKEIHEYVLLDEESGMLYCNVLCGNVSLRDLSRLFEVPPAEGFALRSYKLLTGQIKETVAHIRKSFPRLCVECDAVLNRIKPHIFLDSEESDGVLSTSEKDMLRKPSWESWAYCSK